MEINSIYVNGLSYDIRDNRITSNMTSVATPSTNGSGGTAGLMSAVDKEKLDGIAAGATTNTTVFTSSANGLAPASSNANKDTAESSASHYYLCDDGKYRQLPESAFSSGSADLEITPIPVVTAANNVFNNPPTDLTELIVYDTSNSTFYLWLYDDNQSSWGWSTITITWDDYYIDDADNNTLTHVVDGVSTQVNGLDPSNVYVFVSSSLTNIYTSDMYNLGSHELNLQNLEPINLPSLLGCRYISSDVINWDPTVRALFKLIYAQRYECKVTTYSTASTSGLLHDSDDFGHIIYVVLGGDVSGIDNIHLRPGESKIWVFTNNNNNLLDYSVSINNRMPSVCPNELNLVVNVPANSCRVIMFMNISDSPTSPDSYASGGLSIVKEI